MTTNYQVMENQENGVYTPDYERLIKNATCEEEAQKWREAQQRGMRFAFNLVVCLKQACGHWEIFQQPATDAYPPVEELLRILEEESSKRRCTRCICGF